MTAGPPPPSGPPPKPPRERKSVGATGPSSITRLSGLGADKRGSGLDVLIVDDASDNAEMLAELVTACGHDVRIAHRGSSALEMLESKLADMVFLDVSLPDMDGYEVATTIRIRFGKRCWIVAMTGFSGNGERENAHLAGCDAFVVKPFGFPEIKDLLEGGAMTSAAERNPLAQTAQASPLPPTIAVLGETAGQTPQAAQSDAPSSASVRSREKEPESQPEATPTKHPRQKDAK